MPNEQLQFGQEAHISSQGDDGAGRPATTKPARPRVKRIDKKSDAFKRWIAEAKRASPERVAARPAARKALALRAAAAAPLAYLHAYMNIRPRVDVNTCGQAAIATLLDFYAKDPFSLQRVLGDVTDGKQYWNDGEAIDAVKASGFGPDALGGLFGTTPARMKAALTHFGLRAAGAYVDDAGSASAWSDLQAFVRLGRPVPVLVDTSQIGGPKYGLHWAIAYRIDEEVIYLGNWRPDPFTADVFLSAWRCPQVPTFVRDYHFCAVYAMD